MTCLRLLTTTNTFTEKYFTRYLSSLHFWSVLNYIFFKTTIWFIQTANINISRLEREREKERKRDTGVVVITCCVCLTTALLPFKWMSVKRYAGLPMVSGGGNATRWAAMRQQRLGKEILDLKDTTVFHEGRKTCVNICELFELLATSCSSFSVELYSTTSHQHHHKTYLVWRLVFLSIHDYVCTTW